MMLLVPLRFVPVIAVSLAALVLSAGGAAAAEAGGNERRSEEQDEVSNVLEAVEQGTFSISLRYRCEMVDDEAFALDARSSTLRTALAFETSALRRFSVGIGLEDVTAIGNDKL